MLSNTDYKNKNNCYGCKYLQKRGPLLVTKGHHYCKTCDIFYPESNFTRDEITNYGCCTRLCNHCKENKFSYKKRRFDLQYYHEQGYYINEHCSCPNGPFTTKNGCNRCIPEKHVKKSNKISKEFRKKCEEHN